MWLVVLEFLLVSDGWCLNGMKDLLLYKRQIQSPFIYSLRKKEKKPGCKFSLYVFMCILFWPFIYLFIYSCESVCECVCGFIKIPFYLCLPPQSMLQQNTTFFPSTLCVLHISVRDKLLIRQEAEGSSYFHLAADWRIFLEVDKLLMKPVEEEESCRQGGRWSRSGKTKPFLHHFFGGWGDGGWM